MEQGFHRFDHDGDDNAFFEAVVERLIPLAESRLVIENSFVPDLPQELWQGDDHTESIHRAGIRMGELDLLPAPWPIDELLTADELRHVMRLFGIGGLSYGNASRAARRRRFWMSASGVDKSRLREVGTGDPAGHRLRPHHRRGAAERPAHVRPRRVSVDAIEHLTIYREHPEVGGILHVHGWMAVRHVDRGSLSVRHRRAGAGSGPAREAGARSVARRIGLKNHGLTITATAWTRSCNGSVRASCAGSRWTVPTAPGGRIARGLRLRFGASRPTNQRTLRLLGDGLPRLAGGWMPWLDLHRYDLPCHAARTGSGCVPSLAGICGTDMALLTGHASAILSPFASFPAVLGHEVVGVVEEDGRRVVVDPIIGCTVRALEPPPLRGRADALLRAGDRRSNLPRPAHRLLRRPARRMVRCHGGASQPAPPRSGRPCRRGAVLVEPFGVALHAVLRLAHRRRARPCW